MGPGALPHQPEGSILREEDRNPGKAETRKGRRGGGRDPEREWSKDLDRKEGRERARKNPEGQEERETKIKGNHQCL